MRFHRTVTLTPGVNFRHLTVVMVLMDPILNTDRTENNDNKSYLL